MVAGIQKHQVYYETNPFAHFLVIVATRLFACVKGHLESAVSGKISQYSRSQGIQTSLSSREIGSAIRKWYSISWTVYYSVPTGFCPNFIWIVSWTICRIPWPIVRDAVAVSVAVKKASFWFCPQCLECWIRISIPKKPLWSDTLIMLDIRVRSLFVV